jgi:hypothetical protein
VDAHAILPCQYAISGVYGQFARYLFSALAECHDDKDVICLAGPAVNVPNPAMQSEYIVRKQGTVSKKRY